jgi:hypothetical protein
MKIHSSFSFLVSSGPSLLAIPRSAIYPSRCNLSLNVNRAVPHNDIPGKMVPGNGDDVNF